jgi:hypothetical protein
MSTASLGAGHTATGLRLAAGSIVVGAAIGAVRPNAGLGFAFLLAAAQGMLALASP